MRVDIKNIIFKSIVYAFCGISFSACAVFSGYDNSNYQKKVLLDNESCEMLATFDETDDLVYNGSYYGLLARTCKEYKQSNEIFDKVEDKYKTEEDLEGNASKAAKAVGTFLINETIKDYQSYDFERSMINIYKALNFMSLGDFDSANAELNRALKRDDILGEKYLAMNQAAVKELKESTKDLKDNTDEILKDLNQSFAKYTLYKNNINPMGKYLRSIVYMMDGEPNKASDLLRELVAEYNGKNSVILDDYKLAEKMANSTKNQQKYIWLMYENGISPTIISGYIPYTYSGLVSAAAVGASFATGSSVPAFVALMNHTTILAVPMMEEGVNSFDYLSINGVKTQTISDMNAVMANELKGKLTSTVSKTIYSNITKDFLTVGAGMLGGGVAMIGMDVYKQVVNTADSRIFIGLPNSFDVARVANNGKVVVKDNDGNVIFDENVDKSKHVIVYVKSRDFDNTVVYKIQK